MAQMSSFPVGQCVGNTVLAWCVFVAEQVEEMATNGTHEHILAATVSF